jgi:uncharacterized membrane protein
MTPAPAAPVRRPAPGSSLRHDPLTRGLGVASGCARRSATDQTPGLRSASTAHPRRPALRRPALTVAGLVVIPAVDLYAAVTRTTRRERWTAMELTSTTTVTRPPEDVYAFWRQLDRLPTFMAHLDEVRAMKERRSHWKASAPFGRDVEWDAETTDDVPAERIAWRSLDGADVPNSGRSASCPRRVGGAPRCT